jgi:hypothetical protein
VKAARGRVFASLYHGWGNAEEMSRHSHNYARFAKRYRGLGDQTAWGDMRGLLNVLNTRGFACVATFFGAGAIATLVGDWSASDAGNRGASEARPVARAELSPADAVAFRFPFDWNEAVPAVQTAAAVPPAQTAALTKAAHSGVATQQALLSPRPTTYQLASATVGQLPAMAYAPEPAAAARNERVPEAVQGPAKPAPEKSAAAPAAAKPAAAAAAPAPKRDTRQVLNDAQISSIKKRLALTPDQERYWPAVEHALRQMAWKKTPGEKAKVDMSTVDVDGLKSAAFPLVMSFSDDQKRELRSLANVMGLESVASRF